MADKNLKKAKENKDLDKEASIQQFQPNSELVLPEARVDQLQVPSTSVNNIQSDVILID